jgi:flagellar basal-body rod modification protein FlgD
MVSDVTIQTAIDQQSQTSASSAALAEDFTQFLTLLTVQLQNQDPLSPMDSTEFTNQLVAFTQVEQQINSNEKLDSLIALGLSESMSNAQSYVGNDISYISSEFYFDGSPQVLRYSLPEDAQTATMRIYNEAGGLVYEEDVSGMSGAHDVTWNGQLTGGGIASDGTYEIVIDALDANNESIDATTVVTGQVSGVESQSGQIYLLVGERAVALGNVLNSSISKVDTGNSENITAALNYVGLDVGYDNNEFLLGSSGTASIGYTLADDAERAKIHIYNDQGELVFTDNVETSAGSHSYEWDASGFSAGEYTFEIDAVAKATSSIKNSEITYTGSGDANISYTLQDNYEQVQIVIQDSSGNTVFTDTADRTNGAHNYVWDGLSSTGTQMPSGDYTVKITATASTDERVAYTSSATGRVTGVEVDNGVIFLQIGPTTSIPLTDITSVSVPDEEEGGSA